MNKPIQLIILCCCICSACNEEFLNEKPSSNIINPTTIVEYQKLLDHDLILNKTGALPQMSSDEYYIVSKSNFDALPYLTQKNAYTWQKDIYGGEVEIPDWNKLYQSIFYANNVLEGLENIAVANSNQREWNNLRGQALFYRSFAFYDLARNFCPIYNEATADADLGIPLRTSAGIDETVPRSSMNETFDRIIADLHESKELLINSFSTSHRNRPSKTAVFALLARIYLYMGKYAEAEVAADSCLNRYNKLIDYNTVDTASTLPFSYTSDEIIFYSTQVIGYSATTSYNDRPAIAIDSNLINFYNEHDLRLAVFFLKNKVGNYNMKRGYIEGGLYPFTGLATDEIYLIKAECLARRDDPQAAISLLNELLLNRYKAGTYVPIEAATAADALNKILLERRKELIWRALRWSDLKRLNRDGASITLTRKLDGKEFTLAPNSPLYAFPIPDDELILSKIQ